MSWFTLFIDKYLREDYNIHMTQQNLKSTLTQMIKEGYISQDLIYAAENHEEGENTALHEIVSKIAKFIDTDNYKMFPSTIKVTRETKEKLDALKDHPRQSYNEVILKLLK